MTNQTLPQYPHAAQLSWENWVSPHFGGTITASSEAGNMPASNLINSQPGEPWRSNAAGTQTLSGSFNTTRVIKQFFFGFHNLNYENEARLRLYQGTISPVLIFDQSWVGDEPLYEFGQDPFGMIGFGGYSDEGWSSPVLNKYTETELLADSWEIELTGKTSGYYQAGYLHLGDYWVPERGTNMEWGYAPQRMVTMSKQRRTRSGGVRGTRFPTFRELKVNWKHLTAYDSRRLNDFIDYCRLDRPLIFSGYPRIGGLEEREHTVFSFIKNPSAIPVQALFNRTFSITLAEGL